MKAQRFDEFHKYGYHFAGKLVVVDYTADVMSDQRFGSGLSELDKAKKLVADLGYNVVCVLLDIPEYVVEIS